MNNNVYIFKNIIQDTDSNDENATYSEMIHNQSNKKMNTLISLVLLTTLKRLIDKLSSNSMNVQLRKNR
jgi:hypothetical protein